MSKLKNNINCCIVLIIATISCQGQSYKNAQLTPQQRARALLHLMSIEEKVAQLRSTHAGKPRLDNAFFNSSEKIDSFYADGIGMVNPVFDETFEITIQRRNELQKYLKQHTRLGIPAIFLDEAHHGLVQNEVHVFPHAIGLACSWDTSLLTKVYDFISRQANSRGASMVLAPVVDVARDPRWGRTGETWGEDPFLNGAIGNAVVRGLQGSANGQIAIGHVAATLKHFTGHGEPEAGNNQSPANYSLRSLREFHMEPFRLIVGNSYPAAIMASYNEVDEIPTHANKWLLTDVLRKEWHFNGLVLSDWFAIDQLYQKHLVAKDRKDAALKAFQAGVTVDLPYGINYNELVRMVNAGKIKESEIDSAVVRVLALKFQMGLFDSDSISIKNAYDVNMSKEGRILALKIAEESMVLLKNDGNLLPILPNQFKRIAVIGPCGAVNYLGDYSGVPQGNVSVLQGIRNAVAKDVEVVHAIGCMITQNGDTISQNNYQFTDTIIYPSFKENKALIDEAKSIAAASDFIVVAVGANELISREAWAPNHWGDISDLNLQSQQEELVKAIAETGKPYVVYLAHGQPLSINWIAKNAPAIIDGWYSGEEAGNAFANILFGKVNPSGKLTISIPRAVGQLPIYYNHKPSAHYFEYVNEKSAPIYPFGYGLSYSKFEYGKLEGVDNVVSFDLTNTGTMAGDEIVQLYIHQRISDVVRPIKELKGFKRITLQPGEKKHVMFSITNEMLKQYNLLMEYVVDPGEYEIMIGANSADCQKIDFVVKKDGLIRVL